MDLSTWIPALILAVNILCIVHIIRKSRSLWWILGIFFFPLLGPLVYFFVEIVPDLRRGELSRDVRDLRENLRTTKGRIRRIKKELEATPTVEKTMELAEAYGQAGQWDDAVRCYRGCARGPFEDDTFVLYGYARSLFHSGDLNGAERILRKIDATKARDKADARRLLRLRILEQTGRSEEALEAYPRLLESFSGEEARYRYACLLKKHGQEAEAREQFQRIAAAREEHSRLYRRQNREWIAEARKQLK